MRRTTWRATRFRLVLWKIYARTGRLMVRMPERAVSPAEKTLAYLVAAPGDEPAAGIACAAIENDLKIGPDYLLHADGATACTRNVPEAVDQVVRSVNARSEGGTRLESLLVDGENQGIQACLMFVPPQARRLARSRCGERRGKAGAIPRRHRRRRFRRTTCHAAASPIFHSRSRTTCGRPRRSPHGHRSPQECASPGFRVIDRLSGHVFPATSLPVPRGLGKPSFRERESTFMETSAQFDVVTGTRRCLPIRFRPQPVAGRDPGWSRGSVRADRDPAGDWNQHPGTSSGTATNPANAGSLGASGRSTSSAFACCFGGSFRIPPSERPQPHVRSLRPRQIPTLTASPPTIPGASSQISGPVRLMRREIMPIPVTDRRSI